MADPPPPTPHQFQDVLVRFAGLLEHSRITYMIVGAVAVGAWGRPRATADIDITVLADETGLEAIVRAATGLGLEVDRHWMEWNPVLRGSQVRLAAAGVSVDVMRPRDRHEEMALQRHRTLTIDEHRLRFVSPDDLILMKLKAGRPRDFEDTVGILAAQREGLDEAYLADWARRLGIADELAYVLRESGR